MHIMQVCYVHTTHINDACMANLYNVMWGFITNSVDI